MWRLMLFLAIGGIALIIYGGREFMLGKDSSSEPEHITIEELEKGVPTNPYRRLDTHIALLNATVYRKRERGGTVNIDYAYYPVVSLKVAAEFDAKLKADKDNPETEKALIRAMAIKVVVKTRRWKTLEAMNAELWARKKRSCSRTPRLTSIRRPR
jgi:hypothetical protein